MNPLRILDVRVNDMRAVATAAVALAVLATGACAPVPPGDAVAPPRTVEERDEAAAQDTMLPPGYGSLTQDEVTISIRSGPLLVKVTPLHESVLRTLAPDTYTRLHAVRQSRRGEAERAVARDPEMFLVSFFSYEPDVPFQPEDVQLSYQGRLLRAAAILPSSAGWGRQALRQQESQTAVYVYEGPIRYNQPFVVRYGSVESDEWDAIIDRLELERTRIRSRVR